MPQHAPPPRRQPASQEQHPGMDPRHQPGRRKLTSLSGHPNRSPINSTFSHAIRQPRSVVAPTGGTFMPTRQPMLRALLSAAVLLSLALTAAAENPPIKPTGVDGQS